MDGWRLARLAALAALALLLTGCLKLDMDLQIRSDDTVDGGVVFAVDKDLLELTGGSFEDLTEGGTPFPSDVEGVRIEEYDDGEYVGQRYVFEGVALSEFTDPANPESLQIVREGDTFVVSGVLDLSSGATGATGVTAGEQFFSSAEIRVAVTFPGEVISSNGRVEGSTVIWEPKFGERLEIEATGSAVGGGGGLGSPLTIVLLVVGVAAVAGVIALVAMSRRRSAAPAVAAVGGEGAPAETGPGGAGSGGPGEVDAALSSASSPQPQEEASTGPPPEQIPPPPPPQTS
jgi:hypothetical protein